MAIIYKNLSSDYPILGTFKRANGDYLVVTEASRPVDDEGWTVIQASEDTHIVYVSSSEGDDAAGIPYKASDVGVSQPDDEPQGDFLKRATPIMTDSTSPSGQVSASSQWSSSTAPWKAFNRDGGNWDLCWATNEDTAWLRYDFDSPKTLKGYAIKSFGDDADTAPRDWTFEAKNDGDSEWTELDSVANEGDWARGERREFRFENEKEFESYRLNIFANNGHNNIYVEEFELLEPSETFVPVATRDMARFLAHEESADWILLKRGDEWEGRGLLGRTGRSLAEPFVVSSYGSSPERPRVERTGVGGDNVVFSQISAGFIGVSDVQDVLVEDCVASGVNRNGFTFSGADGVELRRNIVAYNHNDADGSDHRQGIYSSGTERVLLEENLFHNNGWKAGVQSGTIYNHNIYIGSGHSPVTLYRNIISEASSHGIQMGGGGTACENVFVRNPINVLNSRGMGRVRTVDASQETVVTRIDGALFKDRYVGHPLLINEEEYTVVGVIDEDTLVVDRDPQGAGEDTLEIRPGVEYFTFRDNVVTEAARYINRESESLQRAWGMEITDLSPHTTTHYITGNIFSYVGGGSVFRVRDGDTSPGGGYPQAGINSLVIEDNITYRTTGSVGLSGEEGRVSNLMVRNNTFQTWRSPIWPWGRATISSSNSFVNETTLESNVYYDEEGDNNFFIEDDNFDFNGWASEMNETGSSYEQVDFVDPDRSVGGYQEMLSGESYVDNDAAFEAFIEEAMKQSRHNWRTEYTAIPILAYFREGFNAVGEDPRDFEASYNIGPAERDHTEGVTGAIGV